MKQAFRKWEEPGIYGAAAVICFGLTYVLLELWRADLRIPFTYGGGDELPICMWIKGLRDNAWIFHNSRIGMPFGLELFDYPLPESFHLLVFKLVGFTTRHFGKILNLFYLATYPAVLLTSLYTCRQLGLRYPAALFTSFLYTFLPFHFRRGEAHLFLSAYYIVPLILLVIFRVFSPEAMFFGSNWRTREGLLPRFRRTWGAILVCVIVGSSGIGYYAFFACLLLVVAGIAASVHRGRLAPFLNAMVVAGLIAVTVLLNISPNLVYGRRDTASRTAADAEVNGLKIAQLLLPMTGHRLPFFAEAKARYNNAPLVNENDTATLGLVGSAGFLFLLGWISMRVLGRGPRWLDQRDRRLLDRTGLLLLAATLLGTIGGFGSLFAFLIQPQFRGYNRISVFIAFLGLFAIGLLVDRFLRRRLDNIRGRILWGTALVLLLTGGILDQTTPLLVPEYEQAKHAFIEDERFVHSVEGVVPSNSMIFQLPYMQFPEVGGVNRVLTYDHARGYLHSQNLRWSYGAMKGEASDAWQQAVVGMPLSDMTQALACAGFSGIYLDRFGYADNGTQMVQDLSRILEEGPLVANARLLFFSLDHYRATLRRGLSESEWRARQDRLNPPFVVYEKGFYPEEVTPGRVWRWSRAQSSLHLFNVSSTPKTLLFEVTVATGYDEFSNLQIASSVLNTVLRVNRAGTHIQKSFVLPVGETEIKFTSDASRVNAPGDERKLFFGIQNLTLKEVSRAQSTNSVRQMAK
jgi:phosphoglycerol transferase